MPLRLWELEMMILAACGMKMYRTLYWCCWPVIVLSHPSNGIEVLQFKKKKDVILYCMTANPRVYICV
jgi:hypothetical protein